MKLRNKLLGIGALTLAGLVGAEAKAKPKCEPTSDGKICRLKEPDRNITFQIGELKNGSKYCEVKVEKDSKFTVYDAIGCQTEVTSYIKGAHGERKLAITRDDLEDHFAKDIDPEYNRLAALFGRI